MIGIIVAAGKAKRLGNVCKALIKVKGKPIIEYIFDNMKDMKKIIIIHHGKEIPNYVGNDYCGIPIKYVEQKRRKGIAHAIFQCRKKVDDDVLIILGDIIYFGDLKEEINTFQEFKETEFAFGYQIVKDKQLIKKSYGITNTTPMNVIEKPTDEDLKNMENYLGLGIYMARQSLFKYIKRTPINKRTGEIEFTDTINQVPKDKCILSHFKGFYKNINTKKDLEEVNGK